MSYSEDVNKWVTRPIVSAQYEAIPDEYTDDNWYAWEALRLEVERLADVVERQVMPLLVEGQPYKTANALCVDIETRGIIKVSTDANEHPFWTPEHNLKARYVHDILGHWGYKGRVHPFSFKGERAAFRRQSEYLRNAIAIRALYVEVVGQAAYRGEHGVFPKQKIGFMKGY